MDNPFDPRLPQELERMIFEIAGRSDRAKTLPILTQVAHRVRIWLQPLLYEIVILQGVHLYHDSTSFLSRFRPRYPTGSQTLHVRALLLYGSREDPGEPGWREFLPQCHNLQDLAMWCHMEPEMLSMIASIIRSPLRTAPSLLRLSVSLVMLFSQEVDFNHEILKDITHLDVLDHPDEVGEWKEGNSYACMRNLRYLAFAYFMPELSFPHETLKRCLEECEHLELIILPTSPGVREGVRQLSRTRVKKANGVIVEEPEDRLVILEGPSGTGEGWGEGWYKGAAGDDDFWTTAERTVKRRKCKREYARRSWEELFLDLDLESFLGE